MPNPPFIEIALSLSIFFLRPELNAANKELKAGPYGPITVDITAHLIIPIPMPTGKNSVICEFNITASLYQILYFQFWKLICLFNCWKKVDT